jgi:hypothetical protein
MKIIIYHTNADAEFAEAGEAYASANHPTATVRHGNPRYFTESTAEQADLVIVRPHLPGIRNVYTKRNTPVICEPGTMGNPDNDPRDLEPDVIKAAVASLQPDQEADVVTMTTDEVAAEVAKYDPASDPEVQRLVKMTVDRLEGALSRVHDRSLLEICREVEAAKKRPRKGALEAYDDALKGI